MKCGRDGCKNEAAINQKFCSKICAPYGNFGVLEKPTKSSTEKSGTTVLGAVQVLHLKNALKETHSSGRDMQQTKNTEVKNQNLKNGSHSLTQKSIADASAKDTERFRNMSVLPGQKQKWNETQKTEQSAESKTAPAMREAESNDSKQSAQAVTVVTPHVSSIELLPHSEMENLLSLSSVNDLIKRFHNQAKRLMPHDKESDTAAWPDPREVERAQAACLIGLTIGKLIRVKIDGAKAVHAIQQANEEKRPSANTSERPAVT